MIKVMSIFGTRPEAIKMAPVIQEMNRHRQEIQSVICVTAQHREMLDSVLETFQIVPDYDLNIMKRGQTLEAVTGRILEGLGEILDREEPDLVLVHGDTTTTFASRSITEFRWDMWRQGFGPTTSTRLIRRKPTGRWWAIWRNCILPQLCGA